MTSCLVDGIELTFCTHSCPSLVVNSLGGSIEFRMSSVLLLYTLAAFISRLPFSLSLSGFVVVTNLGLVYLTRVLLSLPVSIGELLARAEAPVLAETNHEIEHYRRVIAFISRIFQYYLQWEC